MAGQTKDMTTGSSTKLILTFGLPLLAGNILQQLYNMVDTIVVGRGVGVDALAAVGATGSINFLVLGFIMGMAQGVSILVAQFFGSGDMRRLRQSITMSGYISIAVCLLMTIISVAFTRSILVLMDTPEAILTDAVNYIRIIFLGMSVSYAYNFFSGILRAVGASKKDIAHVFNAETFIEGFISGILGIGVTLILCIPINIIINSLINVKNIATLPLYGGVGLILLSVILTLIAGIIPSNMASKKDPVEALRSE